MQKDHRPYFLKKLYLQFETFYTRRFLQPHLEHLGQGFTFMRPWHVEIFGAPVRIGDYATVIAGPDCKVRLAIWSDRADRGKIDIGNYCIEIVSNEFDYIDSKKANEASDKMSLLFQLEERLEYYLRITARKPISLTKIELLVGKLD